MNPVLQARLQKRSIAQVQTRIAEHDGRLIISQSQDCTPIAEYAKQQQKLGNVGSSEMRHAAKIPDVIINKYLNETGITYQELMSNPVHFRRICNNPDNAAFRIWQGRV